MNSGSEDANAEVMERSEVVSSAASGSDGLTQTENDDTLSETGSEEDTLNLVEGAILRTLRRYSSQQKRDGGGPGNARRVEEGTRRQGRFNSEEPHSADSVNGPAARSSTPEDSEMLANLLEQVHGLRRNQRHDSRRPKETLPTDVHDVHKPTRSSDRRRGKEKKPSSPSTEELRVTLEAAAMAAKAAADAAEAALESVARNTEAIDFIVKSMQSSKERHKVKGVTDSDGKEEILKSNRITHWILGFMAVSSLAWRFGVVKVVKGVSDKFNDPFKYLGKMVGGDDDEEDGEKSSEDNFFEKLSHVDLPSMLQNDPNDPDTKEDKLSILQNDSECKRAIEKKGKETKSFLAKSATAVDVKTKEAGEEAEKSAFRFANLFQAKEK